MSRKPNPNSHNGLGTCCKVQWPKEWRQESWLLHFWHWLYSLCVICIGNTFIFILAHCQIFITYFRSYATSATLECKSIIFYPKRFCFLGSYSIIFSICFSIACIFSASFAFSSASSVTVSAIFRAMVLIIMVFRFLLWWMYSKICPVPRWSSQP